MKEIQEIIIVEGKSDKQFLETSVYSSEELYWAVENKVTPIPVKDSPAEDIYNLAKDTLRNIISDDMTDYEKALCIFDWICTNTVYDNYSTFPTSYGDYCNTNIPNFIKNTIKFKLIHF